MHDQSAHAQPWPHMDRLTRRSGFVVLINCRWSSDVGSSGVNERSRVRTSNELTPPCWPLARDARMRTDGWTAPLLFPNALARADKLKTPRIITDTRSSGLSRYVLCYDKPGRGPVEDFRYDCWVVKNRGGLEEKRAKKGCERV